MGKKRMAVTRSLTNMPPDIILQVLEQAETSDIQSLIETNRKIREVSGSSKGLWIRHAIGILRRMRSLYLPSAQSPNDYELPQLRSAVCRASRLEANWNSESPELTSFTMTRPTQKIYTGEGISQMFMISSEHLLLYKKTGLLQLFNFRADKLIGEVKYREGIVVYDCKFQSKDGSSQILCLIGSNPYHNFIIEQKRNWTHIVLQINAPSMSIPSSEALNTKEWCKIRCSGDFLSAAILDFSKKSIYIMMQLDDLIVINFVENYETGKFTVQTFKSDNAMQASVLVYYPSVEKMLLYDIFPNRRIDSTVELADRSSQKDKNRMITKLDIQSKTSFKWNIRRSKYYPVASDKSADGFGLEKIHRNVLSNLWDESLGDLQDLTSIAALVSLHTPMNGKDGCQLDKDTDWIIMQHYSTSDRLFGKMCIVQIKHPQNNTYCSPMVAVSFNHAAWVEVDPIFKSPRALKFATFVREEPSSLSRYDKNKRKYNEARIKTLDIPKVQTPFDKEGSLLPYIHDIIIDESQGIILLHALDMVHLLQYA